MGNGPEMALRRKLTKAGQAQYDAEKYAEIASRGDGGYPVALAKLESGGFR